MRVIAWQQAPRCRFVGHYFVRAGRGSNVLRFPRRIGKHTVQAGTYHVLGVSGDAEVLDVRVRLVRVKKRLLVRHDGLADVCVATTSFVSNTGPTVGAPSPLATHPPAEAGPPSVRSSTPRSFLPPVIRDLNPANASPLVRAILFALLAGAIAILATSSLPERAIAAVPGGTLVSRHRAAVTLGGLALLAAAALVALLV